MFTPKSGTAYPSSASGRALASSSRRRSSVGGLAGTPYGGLGNRAGSGRSPYLTPSGRNTPTTGGAGAVSQQNQFTVDSYGSALPALVMEALTFADKSGEMSVVLSACGWAWLVTGRRLLVWRYSSNKEATAVQHSLTGTPLSRAASSRASSASVKPELRELLLPQSDLAHRAQLVVLRQHDTAQMPSCLAVSPEGAVRYWPNVAHESTYTEVTAELQGQECDSLVYLSSSLGYFLATTTSTTLLLQPTPALHHGETGITVRHVKVPAGLLGGLSRKVTSLMFGSLPTQAPEARLVRVVCRGGAGGAVNVLVLSAEYLQCWQLVPGQPDNLQFQAPLLHCCQQALASKIQGGGGGGGAAGPNDGFLKSGSVWLLDMQPQPQKPTLVVLLVAAVNPPRQDLILALATVDTSQCPDSLVRLTVLQHSEPPLCAPHTAPSQDDSCPPPPLLHYRLLLSHNTAYVYNKTAVMCVPCNDATIALTTRLPFAGAGDSLLGAGKQQHSRPLFFSATQGIVAVTSPGQGQASVPECSDEGSPAAVQQSSLHQLSMAGLDTLNTASSSPVHRLQAAFMYCNREDMPMAMSILDELFPNGDCSQLPDACLQLSCSLLDDTPATDPRWAEVGGGSTASVGGATTFGGGALSAGNAHSSLIITNQIRDKATAHKYYVDFLRQTGLWSMLGSQSSGSAGQAVRTTLLEHAQRLAFAATLRSKHQQHQLLLDQAISVVVKARGEVPSGRLTPADLFYCRITKIHQIVWGLMQAIEEIVSADVVPRDAPASLHTTSSLLLALLKAATAVTSASDSTASSMAPQPGYGGPPGKEYVPWTASEGPKGIRTLLGALHRAIVETGLQRAEDPPTRSRLYSVLVDLTDHLLGGYQPQLASLAQPAPAQQAASTPAIAARLEGNFSGVSLKYHQQQGGLQPPPGFVPETAIPINHERYQHLLKQYQKERYNLIQPLVEGGQYSQALSLGEKYCDFRTLVEVCDRTADSARLDRYMHQFAAQGFSDFVFRWHLETGKRGRLLSYGVADRSSAGSSEAGEWSSELGRFLKGYSGLEWLHQLSTRDFQAAHNTLREQGLQETTYLARKKTLLSLSKLCKIADGEKESQEGDAMDNSRSSPVDPVLLEEDLILYQEQLPDEVLAAHNLAPDDMRVLTPVEMIQLYTGEDNTAANELDFKKALDLLAFVPSMEEAESLKTTIWVRAVLRDAWHNLDTDTPLDSISDTVLFKTIELAFTQGCSLKELLVPAEELLACEELAQLRKDSAFTFLIQAGYEKIQQLIY